MINYGSEPIPFAKFQPEWDEYMHYLYLPVGMTPYETGKNFDLRVPKRISFMGGAIGAMVVEEAARGNNWQYIYVTARRGWATPGNPLNRPGWHADGFGTPDINYIWSDAYPTRFAIQEFKEISEDHIISAQQFEEQVNEIEIAEGIPNMIYRLDPSVIHATPIIPAPGGNRSFFKVSFSNSKYNLRGNSHNYMFDYDWKMWDRAEVRNDPRYAGGDSAPA